MPEWDAEVTADERLVRGLLADQFPELSAGAVRLLAEGWDNAVWLVDGRWAFRFPRRAIAVPLLERETAALRHVAPHLPLPVPRPTFIGRPGRGYPWPFVGGPYLHGTELAEARLPDGDRTGVARSLGAFLRVLHGPALIDAAPPELPIDPNRRADMRVREPRARERLDELARRGLWHPSSRATALLDAAVALPPEADAPMALTHGDLHARHVLVDGPTATGVIDWGDVCVADPAIDLSVAFGAFRGKARTAFFDAYGPVTDDQLIRARVLALFLSATLLLYADDVGLTALRDEVRIGLDRAVEP